MSYFSSLRSVPFTNKIPILAEPTQPLLLPSLQERDIQVRLRDGESNKGISSIKKKIQRKAYDIGLCHDFSSPDTNLEHRGKELKALAMLPSAWVVSHLSSPLILFRKPQALHLTHPQLLTNELRVCCLRDEAQL